MNFVRRGPGYIFLRTRTPGKLEYILNDFFPGQITNFSRACELAEEEDTIIFITPMYREKTLVEDAVGIMYFKLSPVEIMATLISEGLVNNIDKVEPGPGQLVMRVPEEGKKIIEEIREAYGAGIVSLIGGIDEGEKKDTILSFTDRPLRKRINSLELIRENLLIARNVNTLHSELRRDAVRYITHGLEGSQWYEIRINIYDNGERYEEQYERLVLVLKDMETGFILGEAWTRDQAFVLLSVAAYQVKLFTIEDPVEIKKILMALEYDGEGNRIVDLDVYYKNKKLEWGSVRGGQKKSRVSLGMKLRQELFARLSEETVQRVKEIEEQVL